MYGYKCFQLIAHLLLNIRHVSVNNNSHPQGDYWSKKHLALKCIVVCCTWWYTKNHIVEMLIFDIKQLIKLG